MASWNEFCRSVEDEDEDENEDEDEDDADADADADDEDEDDDDEDAALHGCLCMLMFQMMMQTVDHISLQKTWSSVNGQSEAASLSSQTSHIDLKLNCLVASG